MTVSAPILESTCRLCDTETEDPYCSPECVTEAAALVALQRIVFSLAAAAPKPRILT